MSSEDNCQNPPVAPDEKNKVLAVYGLFCAALIMGFIPNVLFCLVTLLLFIAIIPVANHVRGKAPPESLTASHMTYIIRTVSLVSIGAVALLIPAAIYICCVYDTEPLAPCVEAMVNALDSGQSPGPEIVMPCVPSFLAANKRLFMAAGMVVAVPVILYLALRLARGINLARRGEPLRDPRRWL